MTVERVWKNTYDLPYRVIVKRDWKLVAHDLGYYDGANKYVISVEINGEKLRITYFADRNEDKNELTKHFDSLEAVQSFVDNQNSFIIHRDTRHHMMKLHHDNKVLTYTIETNEDGYDVVVATWDNEKADKQFFEIGRLYYGFKLDKAHGKTVSEVYDMIEVAMDNEIARSYEDYSGAYYSARECTSCGDGGCVHCSPNSFI